MDVREKLAELLVELIEVDAWDNGEFIEKNIDFQKIASDLIAHGVTIHEWVSVKDRLPKEDGKYLVFEQNSGRTNISILRFAKDARKVDRYDFKDRWGKCLVRI